jgi:hypothetical protein
MFFSRIFVVQYPVVRVPPLDRQSSPSQEWGFFFVACLKHESSPFHRQARIFIKENLSA